MPKENALSYLGKILIITGIILIIIGLVIYFAGHWLGWLGHLPGDIRIDKGNTKFYFPLTTMIIMSILISVLLWVLRKLL